MTVSYSSFRMYSSDSDAYLTGTQRMQSYLSNPLSRHGQTAGDADDEASAADVEPWPPEEETVQLDKDHPEDYGDCPIPRDKWADVPLSPQNSAMVSIRIKRVAFIRQEVMNELFCVFRMPHLCHFVILAMEAGGSPF